MSEVTKDELEKHVKCILKDADLSVVTSKIIRGQLEKSLGCSLLRRKKEIDEIVLQAINDAEVNESESESDDKESEESEKEEEVKPKKKRGAPARKTPAKKKRKSVNGTDTNSESDDAADEDYKHDKKPSTKKGGRKQRKASGFTRPYNLSPELSALMGESSCPRHAVVKKIWSIIKERNLYDPENKQFAICDDQLLGLMHVKRFRTFGMLKHLKPHFID